MDMGYRGLSVPGDCYESCRSLRCFVTLVMEDSVWGPRTRLVTLVSTRVVTCPLRKSLSPLLPFPMWGASSEGSGCVGIRQSGPAPLVWHFDRSGNYTLCHSRAVEI